MDVTIKGQSLHIHTESISAAPKGITTEQPANTIWIQARNGTALQIYESDDLTGPFFTIKANAVPFEINVASQSTKPIFWVRTPAGTDTLEILSIH